MIGVIGFDQDSTTSALDPDYLTVALDKQDISSNSYGAQGCRPKDTSDVRHRGLQECPFLKGEKSPCDLCDFADDEPSSSCREGILNYCTDPANYNTDTTCLDYLEVYATCQFRGQPDIKKQNGLVRGVTEGRKGKGIIFLWAVGNERSFGSDSNFDWQTTSRLTISVAAVDQTGLHAAYSNPGTAVFVSAPGGNLNYRTNWVSALTDGGCHSESAGTSFSCPAVAGVVALMLEANESLRWRDVQVSSESYHQNGSILQHLLSHS